MWGILFLESLDIICVTVEQTAEREGTGSSECGVGREKMGHRGWMAWSRPERGMGAPQMNPRITRFNNVGGESHSNRDRVILLI